MGRIRKDKDMLKLAISCLLIFGILISTISMSIYVVNRLDDNVTNLNQSVEDQTRQVLHQYLDYIEDSFKMDVKNKKIDINDNERVQKWFIDILEPIDRINDIYSLSLFKVENINNELDLKMLFDTNFNDSEDIKVFTNKLKDSIFKDHNDFIMSNNKMYWTECLYIPNGKYGIDNNPIQLTDGYNNKYHKFLLFITVDVNATLKPYQNALTDILTMKTIVYWLLGLHILSSIILTSNKFHKSIENERKKINTGGDVDGAEDIRCNVNHFDKLINIILHKLKCLFKR